MKRLGRIHLTLPFMLATAALLGCNDQPDPVGPVGSGLELGAFAAKGGGGGKPDGDMAGNNLSFPVIWAEGVGKTLPGTPGMEPYLQGVWLYQWGTDGSDPNITPVSCLPDPDEGDLLLNPDGDPFCDDGQPGVLTPTLQAGQPAATNPLPLAKAFVQKDPSNVWQATSLDWSDSPVEVDRIDWGDNLESVDWYTRSQVRTEVVLFQDLPGVVTEYQMRHTAGWGIDEEHGLATELDGGLLLGPGTQATVYTHCARLTIQKLLVDRNDARLADLEWIPGEGWTEPDFVPETEIPYPDELINPHIFNGSVHEGGDGPGYYSAEINVKGRIIFGYTWNVRNLHDDTDGTAAGVYRITFSLDEVCGTEALNTFFADGVTEIMVPLEEEVVALSPDSEGDDGGDTGGGQGVLDFANNLTYMDINILERGGGGGGKPTAESSTTRGKRGGGD